MPQPIHYSHHIHFDFSSGALLQRPKLAGYIGAISNVWNDLDARIGVFLAALLGAEAITVMTIYTDLKSDVAKRSLVKSVIGMMLSRDEKTEFERILATVGLRYDERNRVIHGAWGISLEYPDGLLWSDIRETTVLAAELMRLNAEGDISGQHAAVLRQQKKMLVYKENDFIDMFNRIVDAFNELDKFVNETVSKAFGPSFSAGPKSRLPRV